MSLSTAALVTLADVKTFLGLQNVSTHDAILEMVIESVSILVRQNTNCLIPDTTTVFYQSKIDGSGKTFLYLPQWPVLSIAALTEDDITLVENTDFRQVDAYSATLGPLIKNKGILERINGCKWTGTPLGVVCTYTAGFVKASSAFPADIKLACFVEVGRAFAMIDHKMFGESSRTVDGTSVTLSTDELLPSTLTTLARYTRTRI